MRLTGQQGVRERTTRSRVNVIFFFCALLKKKRKVFSDRRVRSSTLESCFFFFSLRVVMDSGASYVSHLRTAIVTLGHGLAHLFQLHKSKARNLKPPWCARVFFFPPPLFSPFFVQHFFPLVGRFLCSSSVASFLPSLQSCRA